MSAVPFTESKKFASLPYRADIDGLRALAVLAVVIFHTSPKKLPGGFVGVDIFFVISGFLITTILYSQLHGNCFSIKTFYQRRIRRLFPALITVLAFTFLLAWLCLLPGEFSIIGKHISGSGAFINNFLLYSESGYFDSGSYTKPLLHLWSLAVEEQFYLFWPLLLYLTFYFKRRIFNVLAVVLLISFSLNIVVSGVNSSAAYYYPFTRFWELAVGGILSLLIYQKKTKLIYAEGLSLLGLIFIIVSIFFYQNRIIFPGWWALLPTLGTAFIIASGPNNHINQKLLANKLSVRLGLISYPLYLWHWPILSYLYIVNAYKHPHSNIRILLMVLAIVLSIITYLYIEKPIRKKQHVSLPLLCCMLLMIGLGLSMYFNQLSPRLHSKSFEKLFKAANDWRYPKGFEKYKENRDFNIKKSEVIDSHQEPTKMVFLGDSHIEQYSERVLQTHKQHHINKDIFYITYGGCPPIPNIREDNRHAGCHQRVKSAVKFIQQHHISEVVIGASWNSYFSPKSSSNTHEGPNKDFYYIEKNGKKIPLYSPKGRQLALTELTTFLRTLSKHTKVYFVLDTPASQVFDPRHYFSGKRLSLTHSESKKMPEFTPFSPIQKKIQNELKQLAEKAGAKVLNPLSLLCHKGLCRATLANGKPIYKDTSHLRPFFVKRYASFIDKPLLD